MDAALMLLERSAAWLAGNAKDRMGRSKPFRHPGTTRAEAILHGCPSHVARAA
jgi:hypothetical protein